VSRESGQGGWDDDLKIPDALEDEIAQAFHNVERTLGTAGTSWKDGVHVHSYHVGGFPPEVNETMVRLYRHTCPRPHLDAIGVEALGLSEMRIEVRVIAIVP
jgi:enamine deaminase RidA (YjgF/YER057c/UK114 family)